MINRIATLLLVLGLTGTASGQAAKQANLPLAIVMLDELPVANAKAVLIRRKDMHPQNVVLVTKRTSPDELSRAVAVLSNSRKSRGDRVTTDMVAPIGSITATKRSSDHPQASKDLAALRTARTRFVEGVGSRPVVFSHLRPRNEKARR